MQVHTNAVLILTVGVAYFHSPMVVQNTLSVPQSVMEVHLGVLLQWTLTMTIRWLNGEIVTLIHVSKFWKEYSYSCCHES